MPSSLPRSWWTIYDYWEQRWSYPRYLTEFEARNEKLAVQFRKRMHVPDPVLARWSGARWEYQPRLGGPYVALA